MKKILLVSANQMKDPYPVYPLGISYLSAYIKKSLTGFHVELFDFARQDYEAYKEILKKYKPDYVGLSIRNVDDVNLYNRKSFIQHYVSIVETTRQLSDAVIIAGGSGYSIFPEIMFERLKPDFGIYGEGEVHLCELLTAIENKTDYGNINNLVFKTDNKIVFNKSRQSLKNIDLAFDNDLLDYYWQHSGMLNIQTKRGCPFRCNYCTYPLIEGSNVRILDAGAIVESLERLSKEKGIDYVFFTDSIFNIDNKFNYELAEHIISKELDIKWGAYFNFCNLDENLLRLLQRAGLKHIEFGTDSLSDTMLKNYNKPFVVDDIVRISDICAKLNIDYAHFLILAGNGETEQTLQETFDNSKRLQKTVFFPFIGLRIYPGTKIYELALKEGKITASDDLLLPVYYISDNVNLDLLKEKAKRTGKKWVFPDEDLSGIMNKLRSRNKKGPLWEYLIQ